MRTPIRRCGIAAGPLALALLLLVGCGGDDGGAPPSGPDTAAEFLDRGWTRFEADDFNGALADFEAAATLDDALAEPLAGQGWCLLALAESGPQMLVAVARFSAALIRDADAPYIRAGRAAANLGVGGTGLDAVSADADAVIAAAPGFVFVHRPSFTLASVILTAASACAGRGDFDGALDYADRIAASGISPDAPATWVVGGVTCHRYEAAVLAYLVELGRQGAF